MDHEAAFAQIDDAITLAKRALAEDGFRRTGLDSQAVTVCAATVDRLTAVGSIYQRQVKRVLDRKDVGAQYHVDQLLGVLNALRGDIGAGYLTTFEQEIHADVFSDFLSMAGHLVEEKFLLPAAVVAGAALEAHLRALAERNDISLSARGKPKRATALNDDLVGKEVYRKAEQKQVLAWQDLRNSAAHGENLSTAEEVRLMIQGIRDFISRHPA